MKTEVVLKLELDNFMMGNGYGLMKTEVVLKLFYDFFDSTNVLLFNENRSCIEIDLEKFAQGALSRLMKTEVVLKFIHTSKTPCQLCV